jgi:hypothetical protein
LAFKPLTLHAFTAYLYLQVSKPICTPERLKSYARIVNYKNDYQPAQKWLKDRKGRALSYEDIRHYQKIIVALTETDRIMKEIDMVDLEQDSKNLTQ